MNALRKRMSTVIGAIGLVAAMAAAIGCQQPLYDWGNYETSVLHMYNGDSLQVAKEIEVMKKEIERTESAGRKVPPGKRAHLGYLYNLAGDARAAKQAFEAEAAAFPESKVFMQRLAENVR